MLAYIISENQLDRGKASSYVLCPGIICHFPLLCSHVAQAWWCQPSWRGIAWAYGQHQTKIVSVELGQKFWLAPACTWGMSLLIPPLHQQKKSLHVFLEGKELCFAAWWDAQSSHWMLMVKLMIQLWEPLQYTAEKQHEGLGYQEYI